jgi:hypothetical protein
VQLTELASRRALRNGIRDASKKRLTKMNSQTEVTKPKVECHG